MSKSRHLLRTVVGLYACAVAIGVGAAIIMGPPLGAGDALATTYHCRDYFPVLQPVDTNCTANGWLPQNAAGQTSGHAYRDMNEMETDWNRTLELWYDEDPVYEQSNSDFIWVLANDPTYGDTGYVQIGCGMIGDGVYGFCTNDYHSSS